MGISDSCFGGKSLNLPAHKNNFKYKSNTLDFSEVFCVLKVQVHLCNGLKGCYLRGPRGPEYSKSFYDSELVVCPGVFLL